MPNQRELEAVTGSVDALKNAGEVGVLAYREDRSSRRFVDKQSR